MFILFFCCWAKGKVVKNLPALALISAIQPCGRRDALALPQGRENKQDTDASAAAGISTNFSTATQASELYELTCCHCYLPTAQLPRATVSVTSLYISKSDEGPPRRT
jgi:hypothetical protein